MIPSELLGLGLFHKTIGEIYEYLRELDTDNIYENGPAEVYVTDRDDRGFTLVANRGGEFHVSVEYSWTEETAADLYAQGFVEIEYEGRSYLNRDESNLLQTNTTLVGFVADVIDQQ